MNKETFRMIEQLKNAGITEHDAYALRRISMTLHNWHELECGDGNDYASWSIERDKTTDKPFLVSYPHTGKSYQRAIPDREKGALKRLDAIMTRYPTLRPYVQGDPRGCALYVLRAGDVPDGEDASAFYNRGIAIFK